MCTRLSLAISRRKSQNSCSKAMLVGPAIEANALDDEGRTSGFCHKTPREGTEPRAGSRWLFAILATIVSIPITLSGRVKCVVCPAGVSFAQGQGHACVTPAGAHATGEGTMRSFAIQVAVSVALAAGMPLALADNELLKTA
jgi:hypothetical protein